MKVVRFECDKDFWILIPSIVISVKHGSFFIGWLCFVLDIRTNKSIEELKAEHGYS